MKVDATPRAMIIGIGNEYRGDDALGLMAARRLRRLLPKEAAVLMHGGDGAQLMGAWADADVVFVVDAVCSSAPPGTIHRFDASADPLPADFFRHSTHAFGLVDAIELARTFGDLPARLIVYGIEGRTFEAGTELSAEAAGALDRVVKDIVEALRLLADRPKE